MSNLPNRNRGPSRPGRGRRGRQGFTLLEVLVTVSIIAIAYVIIFNTFSTTLTAYTRGNEMLEEIHHGDYVMEQMVMALRSTAFFDTAPGLYGFRLEEGSAGEYPGDAISWVTASSAFMPSDSPFAQSLHRIHLTVERDKNGDYGVAIRAYPPLADYDEEDVDPWFISNEVKGFECRVKPPPEDDEEYEDIDWEDEWEDTNSIPMEVEVTLFLDPIEEFGEPIKLARAIKIPVAPTEKKPDVIRRESGERGTSSSSGNTSGSDSRNRGTSGTQDNRGSNRSSSGGVSTTSPSQSRTQDSLSNRNIRSRRNP